MEEVPEIIRYYVSNLVQRSEQEMLDRLYKNTIDPLRREVGEVKEEQKRQAGMRDGKKQFFKNVTFWLGAAVAGLTIYTFFFRK